MSLGAISPASTLVIGLLRDRISADLRKEVRGRSPAGAHHALIVLYLPYNYKLVGISAPVNITYSNPEDSITVTNEPKTTGWFYDDDEEKNYFHVGGVIIADMNFDSKKIEIAKA